jgi:hypothetical protein
MSPYAILASVLITASALGGAYWQGRKDGRDACQAAEARDAEVTRIASEAAAASAAEAISKIEVKHVTLRQRVEREVRENVVYRECKHSPGGLRDINAALTGADSAGSGELPRASAPQR